MSTMSTVWYDTVYNGVCCVGVDWKSGLLYLNDNGFRCTYRPSYLIEHVGTDMDFIHKAIDLYLQDKKASMQHTGLDKEAENAREILRIIHLADEDSIIGKGDEGQIWLGGYIDKNDKNSQTWEVSLNKGLFPSLKAGERASLGEIIRRGSKA